MAKGTAKAKARELRLVERGVEIAIDCLREDTLHYLPIAVIGISACVVHQGCGVLADPRADLEVRREIYMYMK